jgi:hypothetical protein
MKGITQMNKSTIELAREAGLFTHKELQFELELFANLVRADERKQGQKWFDAVTAQYKQLILAEREACAKVCDELIAPALYGDADKSMWDVTCMDCAAAIRNRGQA